jgi:hypothetical protein
MNNESEFSSRPLSVYEWIGRQLAKWILYFMGWKPFENSKQVSKIKKDKRLVLTISHTSTFDGVIFYLYKFAYPEVFENTVVVVKPQIFDCLPKFLHPILNRMGLVRATPAEEKNGGFVRSIVETLKDKKEFMFIISPKGMIINSPWKSGYYHIAKELNCKIVACGVDYKTKTLNFSEELISLHDQTKEKLDLLIQNKLGHIIPLHIKNSEFSIHKESSNKNTVFAFSFLLIALILFLSYLGWNYKILFFAVLLLLFILI